MQSMPEQIGTTIMHFPEGSEGPYIFFTGDCDSMTHPCSGMDEFDFRYPTDFISKTKLLRVNSESIAEDPANTSD